MSAVTLSFNGASPDVLTCIANLSNDEVFTPPSLAKDILDTIEEAWAAANDGTSIWTDSTVTFLDPFTKSGVFLREITSRLVEGLADELPDLQDRVNHILTKQVFGIGVTRLTSLLARRSLYCSKFANGEHSVVTTFGEGDGYGNADGHIWFDRLEHTWTGGTEWVYTADADGNQIRKFTNSRCRFCGASQSTLDRGGDAESHAYAFIHTDDIKARVAELLGEEMQFDVIIGNPPYQLEDGGYGTSAAPIYQKFVQQAKALDPRLLSMIIPSRWFTGGKGLDDFREAMLTDDRLRSIDDYLTASDVFSGVGLKGGVCYFLWDRDRPGDCRVTTHLKGWEDSTATRPLLEKGADVFVRFNEGVSILKKVMGVETGQTDSLELPDGMRFEDLVSARKPFGLTTSFKGKTTKGAGDVSVHQNGGLGYISRAQIKAGLGLIDTWKIFVSYAAPGTGNRDTYPHRIISTPFLGVPGSISTETYLAIGPFDSKDQVESALSYLSCRLTRLLILLRKSSQHVTSKVYGFVPTQTWDRIWTDEALYEKYGLTQEEIDFIEQIVRPMAGESDD
ncbi:restriction endonuclease [Terrabacter sp. 28]|nr:restriction endonuclease [Terrabacter sp. 28]